MYLLKCFYLFDRKNEKSEKGTVSTEKKNKIKINRNFNESCICLR